MRCAAQNWLRRPVGVVDGLCEAVDAHAVFAAGPRPSTTVRVFVEYLGVAFGRASSPIRFSGGSSGARRLGDLGRGRELVLRLGLETAGVVSLAELVRTDHHSRG